MFVLLLGLIAFIACACDDKTMVPAFSLFKKRFGKVYNGDDEQKRYQIFCDNFETARILNEMHPDTTYGITKFMDLTPEEFQEQYLMKPFQASEFNEKYNFHQEDEKAYFDGDIPDAYNWKDHGAVTGIKNQEACGSCWAFSATQNIEGQWALAGNPLTSFSEQQVVDCDTVDHGCQGGLMDNAFQYVIKAGGIETYDDYPYVGIQNTCTFSSSKIVGKISNYVDLEKNEDQMKAWSYKNGPISIALNANDLQYYTSGVFDPIFCSASELDHGVLITGWGKKSGVFGEKKYWIVKNSWGEDWGEEGYFRILYGKNKCGVAEVPCSSKV